MKAPPCNINPATVNRDHGGAVFEGMGLVGMMGDWLMTYLSVMDDLEAIAPEAHAEIPLPFVSHDSAFVFSQ